MAAVYILLLLYSLISFGGVTPGAGAVIQLAVFTSVFIYLMRGVREGAIKILPSPFHAGAVLFTCLVIWQVSGLPGGSVYPYATRTAFTRYLSYYLFFFLVSNTVKSRRDIFRLAGAVLFFAVGLSFLEVARRMGFIDIKRVFFINPNHFAGWLLMAIIFTLGFFLAGRRSPGGASVKAEKNGAGKDFFNFLNTPQPAFFALSVFASLGLFFSLSRGGMISFAAGMLLLGLLIILHRGFKARSPVIVPFALVLFLSLLWLGADSIFSEFSRMRPGALSADARILVWRSTLDIFRDFPAAGSGLGTFSTVFPAYRGEDLVQRFFSHAHNEYVELLSDTGLAGFLIVFSCFAVFFLNTIRRFFSHRSRAATAFTAGSAAAVFGGLAHAFFDFPFRIPANGLLLALIAGVGTVAALGEFNRAGEIRLKPRIFAPRRPVLLKSVLIAAYLLLAALAVLPAVAGRVALFNPPLAARLEPSNAGHRYLMAREHLDSPDVLGRQRALPHLLKAVELNSYNSRYRQTLGWVYAELGYLEKAERELARAVELDPTNPVRREAYRSWFPDEIE